MGMTLDKILNVECSTYDFKESVEKKKTKSWLKASPPLLTLRVAVSFSV